MDYSLLNKVLSMSNTLSQDDLTKIWRGGDPKVKELIARKSELSEKLQNEIIKSGDHKYIMNLSSNNHASEKCLLYIIEKYGSDAISVIANTNLKSTHSKVIDKIIKDKKYISNVLYTDGLPLNVYGKCFTYLESEIVLETYPSIKHFAYNILRNDSDLALAFIRNDKNKTFQNMFVASMITYKKYNLYKEIVSFLNANRERCDTVTLRSTVTNLINGVHSLSVLKILQGISFLNAKEKNTILENIKIFSQAQGKGLTADLAKIKKAKIMYNSNHLKAIKLCNSVLSKSGVSAHIILNELRGQSYDLFKKIYITQSFDYKLIMLSIEPALELITSPEELESLISSKEIPVTILKELTFVKNNTEILKTRIAPLKKYLKEDFMVKALNSELNSDNFENVLNLAPNWEGSLQDLLDMLEKV